MGSRVVESRWSAGLGVNLGVIGMLRAERRDCGLKSWAWRYGGGRRWRVDDPHPMRARGAKFCDGVSEGADGRHMEDWIGVLAVVEAAFREDNRDEVDATGAEKGD